MLDDWKGRPRRLPVPAFQTFCLYPRAPRPPLAGSARPVEIAPRKRWSLRTVPARFGYFPPDHHAGPVIEFGCRGVIAITGNCRARRSSADRPRLRPALAEGIRKPRRSMLHELREFAAQRHDRIQVRYSQPP